MTVFVLDACALIAYLNQETGADEVDNILSQTNCTRLISIINVYEVCYDAARVSGFEEGVKLYQEIQTLPMIIVREIEEEAMKHAMHFKINYQVSVADSIALGLAKSKGATLVTADHHELDPIDQAKELKFYWIR
jgi:predicted nucleic acid-binding protein